MENTDKKITKEEVRAFYDKLEQNGDPYFYLLPFPDFMVKENPEKYGWDEKPENVLNIYNGIEYEELLKQGKEEEARQHRLKFLKSLHKDKPKPKTQIDRFRIKDL